MRLKYTSVKRRDQKGTNIGQEVFGGRYFEINLISGILSEATTLNIGTGDHYPMRVGHAFMVIVFKSLVMMILIIYQLQRQYIR